jgi:hypothetical protein
MVDPIRLYQIYLIPYKVMPSELLEMFAKALTMFYNDGYDIVDIHELKEQQVTAIIFKLRDEKV